MSDTPITHKQAQIFTRLYTIQHPPFKPHSRQGEKTHKTTFFRKVSNWEKQAIREARGIPNNLQ